MVIFPDFVQIGAHRYKIIYPHVFKERFDRDGMADHELLEVGSRKEMDDVCCEESQNRQVTQRPDYTQATSVS